MAAGMEGHRALASQRWRAISSSGTDICYSAREETEGKEGGRGCDSVLINGMKKERKERGGAADRRAASARGHRGRAALPGVKLV